MGYTLFTPFSFDLFQFFSHEPIEPSYPEEFLVELENQWSPRQQQRRFARGRGCGFNGIGKKGIYGIYGSFRISPEFRLNITLNSGRSSPRHSRTRRLSFGQNLGPRRVVLQIVMDEIPGGDGLP